jgi:hypothetical protein
MNFLGAAVRFTAAIAAMHEYNHKALDHIGIKLVKDSKSYLGEYQPSNDYQPEWAPLADATIADKEAKGFPTPSPLLRTGELRDSIKYMIDGNDLAIGSDDPIAEYQELGTVKIPPRSFLARSVFNNIELIKDELGRSTVVCILGKNY